MLILLEGPELAGKTTLAQRLNSECGFDVIHRGPPLHHVLLEYERTLETWAATDIVLDRWHIGETIYGPMLRGTSLLDAPMERHVDLFLQARGCVVVILVPTLEELDARWAKSTKPELITWMQEIDVARRYRSYGMMHTDCVRLTEATDEAFISLVDEAEDRAHQTAFLRDFPAYVGPPNPLWLFVGDRPAPTHRNGHLAALVPYEGTSGHFLLAALLWREKEHGVSSTFGITNANVGQNTHDLWELLGRPNVVALGRNSSYRLTDEQVPHGVAPHPQLVRRFHRSRFEEYANVLAQVGDTGEDVLTCWA